MKAKIIVAAHKEFPMPADANLYLPILVGAEKNYRDGMKYQRDDVGENISGKNGNYSELTAVYWAWKNLKDVDVIGLVHYRRYLYLHPSASLEDVLTTDQLSSLLKKSEVIVPRKRRYYIETNYSHYVHAHHQAPLDATREAIKKLFPSYLSSFDEVMSRRSAHMFNMFVMSRVRFDSYASFLFGILQEVEKHVSLEGYSQQELRVFGYISELLMDVWINANEINYTEVPWGQIGPNHTFLKALNFLKRKIGLGSRVTHF
ncbi:DUF4422 domain-containing protein [Lactiplantibacillus plantarum]|uniref:DUF4422 domain-containing protein n=1 Tax=Lactiplantibacillus plantarum TaxID=1590 RepID=UPI00093386E5|nr:DUF4422 domain-containing protein [Lactiplantibacillus plantarum]